MKIIKLAGVALVLAASPAAAAPQHVFDYSDLSPEDSIIMGVMLYVIIEECPGMAKYMPDLSADKVDVIDYGSREDGILYDGSSKRWRKRHEFSIRIDDAGTADHPRWGGHRFSIFFSLDPAEIYAEKSMGEVICETPRDGARFAPYIYNAIQSPQSSNRK